MREQLFIYLDRPWPGQAEWLVWSDAEGIAPQVQTGALVDAAPLAQGRRTLVIVPSAEVWLTRVTLPARNRQRLAAAVPYALEEQLAEDVEEMHFALGQHDGNGSWSVAAVSHERMREWLAVLQSAGIHTDMLVPDALAVLHSPRSWTLILDRDYALLRTSAQQGIALDVENLRYALARLLEEAGDTRPETVRLIVCAETPAVPDLDGLGPEVVLETWDGPALGLLARNWVDAATMNLLQGTYSRRERLGKLLRPWRPAAALLAVWLAVQFGMNVTQYYRLKHEQAALEQDIVAIYRQAFPEAKRVVDPRAQMQSALDKLRNGSGGGDALSLLNKVSAPLSGAPGTEVKRINYREGQLELALTVSDLQALDALKARLSTQSGLGVDIQSAAARDDHVDAVLHIKGGG